VKLRRWFESAAEGLQPSAWHEAFVRLAYWLGPWSAARTPQRVRRIEVEFGATRGLIFEGPREPTATYLVLPGLHYAGPDDPRLDRFCRILAASGFRVVAPFIRSFSSLVLEPSAFDDARAALSYAQAQAAHRGHPAPAVFSISFGSRLALELACSEQPPGALLLFGGYAEFIPTVRFAVTGRCEPSSAPFESHRDPLNPPVVFLNLLPELDVSDKPRLANAWIEMVKATWGQSELKQEDRRRPHAERIAQALPEHLQEPFLRGCCLSEGANAWLEDGLERARQRLAYLDGRAAARRARCKVIVVHGRDDDVIPFTESEKLAQCLATDAFQALHLTGLYGHTATTAPSPAQLAREASTLAQMIAHVAKAPHGKL
jgi:pimeloyl-ACP methyl ester carboxylesterase